MQKPDAQKEQLELNAGEQTHHLENVWNFPLFWCVHQSYIRFSDTYIHVVSLSCGCLTRVNNVSFLLKELPPSETIQSTLTCSE
jgi:hypothetical protein